MQYSEKIPSGRLVTAFLSTIEPGLGLKLCSSFNHMPDNGFHDDVNASHSNVFDRQIVCMYVGDYEILNILRKLEF